MRGFAGLVNLMGEGGSLRVCSSRSEAHLEEQIGIDPLR